MIQDEETSGSTNRAHYPLPNTTIKVWKMPLGKGSPAPARMWVCESVSHRICARGSVQLNLIMRFILWHNSRHLMLLMQNALKLTSSQCTKIMIRPTLYCVHDTCITQYHHLHDVNHSTSKRLPIIS